MDSETNDSKRTSIESSWVQDALKLQQVPIWAKRLAIGLTVVSCALYMGLFSLISEFKNRGYAL